MPVNREQLERIGEATDELLDDVAEAHERRIVRSLDAADTRIRELALDFMEGKSRAVFTLRQAQELHAATASLLESTYGVAAQGNVDDLANVVEEALQYFRRVEVPVTFGTVQQDTINALAQQSLRVYQTLGDQAVDRIAQATYDAVIIGRPRTELIAEIEGAIVGHADVRGRPLKQYAKTYARDSVMNTYQTAHAMAGEEADLGAWLYSGTSMKDTRPFCRARVGKHYTREEIDEWADDNWSGKSGHPFTHRGGYNCRHHWQAVDPEWLED